MIQVLHGSMDVKYTDRMPSKRKATVSHGAHNIENAVQDDTIILQSTSTCGVPCNTPVDKAERAKDARDPVSGEGGADQARPKIENNLIGNCHVPCLKRKATVHVPSRKRCQASAEAFMRALCAA